MKKLFCMWLVLSAIILSSCRAAPANGDTSPEEEFKVQYISSSADEYVWDDAKSLSEGADVIVTARVTGVSFQVVDSRTGLPPEEGALESYSKIYGEPAKPWQVFDLTTVYDIEVDTMYKGKISPTRVRLWHGLENVFVEEQLAAAKEYGIEYIRVSENKSTEMKIGQSYLFVLDQHDDRLIPAPINTGQSVYNLGNPFEKICFTGRKLENPPEYYYSRSHTDNGTPLISAYDIISTFGDDKWDAFWSDWKKDNAGWESRIDKAAVDEVLRRG